MDTEQIYDWDPETKTASCIITDDNHNTFYGIAHCHPEDEDMCSEKTGCEIAFRRAFLNALRYYRDTSFKVKYDTLNHFYNLINHSKHFNEQSYEVKMLKRQLCMAKDDLNSVRELIRGTQEELRNYITQKEQFYKKIRSYRKVKQLEEEHKKNQ